MIEIIVGVGGGGSGWFFLKIRIFPQEIMSKVQFSPFFVSLSKIDFEKITQTSLAQTF